MATEYGAQPTWREWTRTQEEWLSQNAARAAEDARARVAQAENTSLRVHPLKEGTGV